MPAQGNRQRITAFLLLAALLAAPTIIQSFFTQHNPVHRFSIGDRFPSLTVLSAELDTVRIDSILHQRTGLILFVSSTCDHCRYERNEISKLAASAARSAVLLTISLNEQMSGMPSMYTDMLSSCRRTLGIRAVPAIYILDNRKIIRHILYGERTHEELEKILLSVLS